METFLWCIVGILGWFGFLCILFSVVWFTHRNDPPTKICPTCKGKGYIAEI